MVFTNCRDTMEGFIFYSPTQVKFIYQDESDINFGIAYHKEIIGGYCGDIIHFEDCSYIETLPWDDIEEYLMEMNKDE